MSRAEQQYQQSVASSHLRLNDYQKREQKALIALVIAGLLLILCCLAGGAMPTGKPRPMPAPVTAPATPGF